MGDEPEASMRPASAEQSLFAEALQYPNPSERAAFLDRACGLDPSLREKIEALLRASDSAGDFLETPPTLLRESAHAAMDLANLVEHAGDHIGRFKLLEKIGEGGCGVVYMAEQEEPVRRRVALKIVKLGMDTRSVIARFEAERQALALMDHPNIARVLDGGATPAGRPFFVMELVRGVRITEFCNNGNLSTEARLRLFVMVCQAIQHAHQKGIIHRDLKPSNILVTVNDGAPVPKVIDFGIAKAVGQRLTDKTLFTQFHSFIGTPAYTSPEQMEITSVDIDTRSDIYSLGVLLYELLTGRTPFDGEQLMSAGFDEMRRIVRNDDPPRPSTVAPRSHEPNRTRREGSAANSLSTDLDWIVMKCLEKDRTLRYDTAIELAADVERHLTHEPVKARPPTFAYRTGKWLRKNKGPAIAATAVLLTLCAGLIAATALYLRERKAWAAELAQRAKAQTEAAKSAQTTQFFMEMLSSIDPAQAQGRDTTVLIEMLEQSANRIETELKGQPEVEVSARTTIGHVYRVLAAYPKARFHLEKALAIRERLNGPDHIETLRLLLEMVDLTREEGQAVNAEKLCSKALETCTQTRGAGDELTFEFQQRLALIYMDQKRFLEAESIQLQTVAANEQLHGRHHLATVMARGDLAAVLLKAKKCSLAEPILRETSAYMKATFGSSHPGALREMANLAATVHELGQFAEAEEIYREVWETEKKVHGEEHPKTLITRQNLGVLLYSQGKPKESETLLRETYEIAFRTLGPDHPRTLRAFEVLTFALDRAGGSKAAVAPAVESPKAGAEQP